MSLYHDDSVTDDLILTIINDGNGSQCGMTYQDRRAAAACNDLAAFRIACRRYNNIRRNKYSAPGANAQQIREAARYLLHYYTEHNTECAK